MSFASKFNRGVFNIDTTGYEYIKLSEIYADKKQGGADVIHSFNGCYVHKSQLGDSPVVIDTVNKWLVNLPSHTAETLRDILSDPDAVEQIKAGKVGYTIYEYDSHAKKCYSIVFVDL